MTKRLDFFILLVILCFWVQYVFADEQNWSRVEQVLIGEAASEGYEGMYAVACVMRNRGWNLDGFSAVQRRDLAVFVRRQPASTHAAARHALERVRQGGVDVTQGATHYENVRQFGYPRWATGKSPSVIIGHHTFWKLT